MKLDPSLQQNILLEEIALLEKRIKDHEILEAVHRQTEEALQASEQRFRSLVEATSDWIWEIDSESHYTYASPKIKDLLGYEPEEIIGKSPFDLMPNQEAERVRALFNEIAQSRRSFSALLNTNLHKNGRIIILETNGVPIFDIQGNFAGYRGFDRNVTERQQANETLRISQMHLAEAMELAHVVYWDLDPETETLIFNDLLFDFCGTSAEREGGYRMKIKEYAKRFIHPGDQEHFSDLITEAILNPEAERVINFDHRLVRRDGKVRHIITRIKIIKDESGFPLRVYGASQDITERKKVEEEREKLIHELQEAISQVKSLSGLLPICSSCKKIRNDKGNWEQMEAYIRDHTDADFSHTVCPECAAKLYPEFKEQ